MRLELIISGKKFHFNCSRESWDKGPLGRSVIYLDRCPVPGQLRNTMYANWTGSRRLIFYFRGLSIVKGKI